MARRRLGVKHYLLRRRVLKAWGRRCVHCGTTSHLTVHHMLPQAQYPERRWDASICIPLCRRCHNQVHQDGPQLQRASHVHL